MELPANADELHLIAEYRTACRALRNMGWAGIAWGVINISFKVGAVTWRGELSPNAAVFVQKTSKEMLVGRRKDVSIKPHGKVLLGSSLKASVRIRNHKWEALILPTAFDCYREWKFREDDDTDYRDNDVDPYEPEPETRLRVKDNWEEPPTSIKDAIPLAMHFVRFNRG